MLGYTMAVKRELAPWRCQAVKCHGVTAMTQWDRERRRDGLRIRLNGVLNSTSTYCVCTLHPQLMDHWITVLSRGRACGVSNYSVTERDPSIQIVTSVTDPLSAYAIRLQPHSSCSPPRRLLPSPRTCHLRHRATAVSRHRFPQWSRAEPQRKPV
jgi:hypothetical protein